MLKITEFNFLPFKLMEAIEVNLLDKTQKLIGDGKGLEITLCDCQPVWYTSFHTKLFVPLLISESYVSLFKIFFSYPGINSKGYFKISPLLPPNLVSLFHFIDSLSLLCSNISTCPLLLNSLKNQTNSCQGVL